MGHGYTRDRTYIAMLHNKTSAVHELVSVFDGSYFNENFIYYNFKYSIAIGPRM